MAPTHYETLEITKESTNEEIKLAYKKLALIHHPDKNPENSEEGNKNCGAPTISSNPYLSFFQQPSVSKRSQKRMRCSLTQQRKENTTNQTLLMTETLWVRFKCKNSSHSHSLFFISIDFENLFRNFTMFFGPGRSFFASNYCHSSRSDSHNPKQPAKPKQTPRRTFMKSYSGGKQTTEVSFNHGENHIVEVLQNDVLRIRTTINIKAGNHLLEMFDDGKLVICTKLDFKNGKTTTKTFEHGILKAEF